MNTLSDKEFYKEIHVIIKRLDEGGPSSVPGVIERLKASGAIRNIHLIANGKVNPFTEREGAEWYAGQVLDVLESNAWFAVNSIIGGCNKYVPKVTDED